MTFGLVPGAFVRHPQRPDWGIGQVQSVVGDRITVNFEHKTDHAHFFELRLGDEPELTVDNREVVWAGFVPAGELSGRPLVPHLRRYLDDAPPRDDQ